MRAIKQRPAPLRISKESQGITKARGPRCSNMQHRLPIVIYTYSPKIIHTDPRSFMSLVQRLTGSTPTRLRCAESTAASDTSHRSEDSSGRILSCDVDDRFDLWTDSDDLAIDQGLCSQIETETISCTSAMENLSLPACYTIISGVERGLSSPRISCFSEKSELKKQARNVEAEMSPYGRFDGQIDQSSSAFPTSLASRLCHVHDHNAGEDLLACLPSLTPSTNDFLRDLPVIYSAENYEALGNLMSPCSIYSPQGACLSSWLTSPGSVTCREKAYALLRDDGVEQYQISI
ncbi:hypothetical protein O6H91_Y073800 [Diphasiastrum complanatum]|nr:hypothetical protein O6H91_Y073800 [Diphasiastrum complanatum]